MADRTFTEGQRVYHDLGYYARWLSFEPAYGVSGVDPTGYSRVEMENTNGRIMHCPTSTLRAAGETE